MISAKSDDTSKVNALNRLSYFLRNTSPLQMKQHAQEALKLSEELNYETGIAESYRMIGLYNKVRANYGTALDYYLKALSSFSAIDDKHGMAETLNNIGNIYKEQKKYGRALNYFQQSLDIKLEINDKRGIGISYTNLGIIAALQNDMEKATKYYGKALVIFEELDNTYRIGRLNYYIGEIYQKKSLNEKALKYYLKALNIRKSINDKNGVITCQQKIADIYIDIQIYDKATQALKTSQELAQELQAGHLLVTNYKLLSKLYEQTGEKYKALECFKIYTRLNDSIYSYETQKQIEEMQTQYDLSKRDFEIQQKEQQIVNQRKQRNRLIVSIIIISIITIIIFIGLLQKNRTNKELLSLNNELNQNREEIKSQTESLREANDAILAQNTEITQQKEELKSQTEHLSKINRELSQLSIIMNKTENAVVIADAEGKIQWINESYTKLFGFTLEEIIKSEKKGLLGKNTPLEVREKVLLCITEKKPVLYELKVKTKDKGFKWIQVNLTPILDSNGDLEKLIAIDTDISLIKTAEAESINQREEIERQRDALEVQRDSFDKQKKMAIRQRDELIQQRNEILDSIIYARRIQQAVLPPQDIFEEVFPDSFIMYKPRDIVSGDFYWFSQRNNLIIIAAADCTGHGVPGAFMSILSISFLNEIVNRFQIVKANEVLNQLRQNIKKSLRQSGKRLEPKDGLDMALCVIETETMKMQYAGANNPLYLIRKLKQNADVEDVVRNDLISLNLRNERECYRYSNFEDTAFIEIRPDKMPIGIHIREKPSFTNHQIQLRDNDVFYLFSDGYVDQLGGDTGRKFLKKRFRTLLINNYTKPFEQQSDIFEEVIEKWQGFEYNQIDDILVMGFKVSYEKMKVKSNRQYDWQNITILIAEDMESSYMIFEEALSETAAQLIWVENGQEAVDYCMEKNPVDIIIMDIEMPIMSGYEAIAEIRKFDSELPIIIEVSDLQTNEKEKASIAGCNDCITKPINSKELLSTISKYI
jgi:PAS domain S-box-containing protein